MPTGTQRETQRDTEREVRMMERGNDGETETDDVERALSTLAQVVRRLPSLLPLPVGFLSPNMSDFVLVTKTYLLHISVPRRCPSTDFHVR